MTGTVLLQTGIYSLTARCQHNTRSPNGKVFKGSKGPRTSEQTPARGSEHTGHFCCQEWSSYHQAQFLNHQTSYLTSPVSLVTPSFTSPLLGSQTATIGKTASASLTHSLFRRTHWWTNHKTTKLDARLPLQSTSSGVHTTRQCVLSRKRMGVPPAGN